MNTQSVDFKIYDFLRNLTKFTLITVLSPLEWLVTFSFGTREFSILFYDF